MIQRKRYLCTLLVHNALTLKNFIWMGLRGLLIKYPKVILLVRIRIILVIYYLNFSKNLSTISGTIEVEVNISWVYINHSKRLCINSVLFYIMLFQKSDYHISNIQLVYFAYKFLIIKM